jgi:hypothetical protein
VIDELAVDAAPARAAEKERRGSSVDMPRSWSRRLGRLTTVRADAGASRLGLQVVRRTFSKEAAAPAA